jgi:hypothetical protein
MAMRMMAGQNAPSAQRFLDRAPNPVSTNSFPKLLVHRRRCRRRRELPRKFGSRVLALAIVSGILSASGGKVVCADLLIEGQPNAIHLEAHDVPLRQLLDAMQRKFNLHYRTDAALDTPVTGIFNGPLRRVTMRLLDDYDFMMKVTPERIEVLVMRRNTLASSAGAP